MSKYLSSSKGFNVVIGVQYFSVLALQVFLAMLLVKPICEYDGSTAKVAENATDAVAEAAKLDSRVIVTAVVVATIILFIVGYCMAKSFNVWTAFAGEYVALLPLTTGLSVLFGGYRGFIQAAAVLAIGIVLSIILVAFKPDLFDAKDKAKSLIPIVFIILAVEIVGVCCKWIGFDLIRLIIVLACGIHYAICWRKAATLNPRTRLGLVDGGTMVILAPFEKFSILTKSFGSFHPYKKIKDWLNSKMS